MATEIFPVLSYASFEDRHYFTVALGGEVKVVSVPHLIYRHYQFPQVEQGKPFIGYLHIEEEGGFRTAFFRDNLSQEHLMDLAKTPAPAAQ